MLCAYKKVGVLSILIDESLRTIIHGHSLKDVRPIVEEKIVPILQEKYKPLVQVLAEKYHDTNLAHEKSDIVWFCWLQGLEQAPELVKVCLSSQKKWVRG